MNNPVKIYRFMPKFTDSRHNSFENWCSNIFVNWTIYDFAFLPAKIFWNYLLCFSTFQVAIKTATLPKLCFKIPSLFLQYFCLRSVFSKRRDWDFHEYGMINGQSNIWLLKVANKSKMTKVDFERRNMLVLWWDRPLRIPINIPHSQTHIVRQLLETHVSLLTVKIHTVYTFLYTFGGIYC